MTWTARARGAQTRKVAPSPTSVAPIGVAPSTCWSEVGMALRRNRRSRGNELRTRRRQQGDMRRIPLLRRLRDAFGELQVQLGRWSCRRAQEPVREIQLRLQLPNDHFIRRDIARLQRVG